MALTTNNLKSEINNPKSIILSSMQTYKTYYKSPLGPIEIIGSQDSIIALDFVEEMLPEEDVEEEEYEPEVIDVDAFDDIVSAKDKLLWSKSPRIIMVFVEKSDSYILWCFIHCTTYIGTSLTSITQE